MLAAMAASSQTLPVTLKRQVNESAPDFPPLPGISLDAISAFTSQSDLALRSVDFTQKSLFLPLISPHRPQDQRFKIKEKSIFVMVRKSYETLKDEVRKFDYDEYSGIYVR